MSQRGIALNTATFVALGDGLAAGAGDFGLSEELQRFSFPAQVAQRLATPFPQPEMEAPGIGPVIGFPDLPVRLPQPMQTTVLKEFPPKGLYANVSLPGLKLIDALTRRPASPLIHRSDGLQTAINLVLGVPGLLMPGNVQLPTAVEYALFRQPTLMLIALGYFDVLDAALKGDPSWVPDDVSFRMNYESVLAPFGRSRGTIVVSTIPDPADTALFTPMAAASRVVKADAAALAMLCGLVESDNLTPQGLVEAGCRVITTRPGRLPEGSVVPSSVIARISERTASLNAQIHALANEHGALVLDLHAVFAKMKREGITVGDRRLTADYLGGIYSLNGVYPGATGHGVIANELLQVLNNASGTSYLPIKLQSLAAADPTVQYRLAPGPVLTVHDLASLAQVPADPPPAVAAPPPAMMPPGSRILLPPGRKATIAVDPESSYFGDALRAAHATIERDIPFGSSPNTFFGGLCLTQSHISGSLTFEFGDPDGDTVPFTMSFGAGLVGQDGVLAAPQFFKLPSVGNKVTDVDGLRSAGELNLATGEVSNLKIFAAFSNSALVALVSVNPKIPPTPIEFSNEARQDSSSPHYGSAWAKFEQRADGTLDFLFSGVSFMPLGRGFAGEPLRFPLPFSGPAMQFASIPAVGSALHPHLCLSSLPPERSAASPDSVPEIPYNTVREYTTFTHNTAFGDKFTMNVPDMEGGATGRSHLLGRALIQFGERSGNSVPVSVSTLMPGGMFAKPPDSPMAKEFPGRLTVGLLGHDETLRFKKIHYDMKGVAWVDDPFEVSLGSIDLRTGRLIGNFLFRGFIIQDVLLTLLKLEPRTPKASWYMRGPAAFEKDPSGQTVFSFNGTVRVAYPEGFGFPRPDLKSVYVVGPNSALDPYFYLQAMDGIAPPPAGKSGGARGVVASNGQRFSYNYAIPGYPSGKPAAFEYINETTGGTFRMGSLVWVSFGNANRSAKPGEVDCVSFTGIGLWSHDMSGPHMCTVQISTAPDLPYVSILIDGGMVSNVNTKPPLAVLPIEAPVHV
jgi:hypothetical protein